MEEVWKTIKGYEGLYEVSNKGQVKSLKRVVCAKNSTKPYVIDQKILKQAPNNQGYQTVCLSKNGKSKTFKVHALVALAFLGKRPDKQEIRHGKKGKLNNSVSNLSYGTHEDNEKDKIRDKTSNHKLSTEKILEIRQIYRNNQLNIAQLSVLYSVDTKCIYKIVKNISYKHVK